MKYVVSAFLSSGAFALQVFAAWKLFLWFVVPLGVPDPSFVGTAGLLTLVRLVTVDARKVMEESKLEADAESVSIVPSFAYIVACSALLVMGYVFHILR